MLQFKVIKYVIVHFTSPFVCDVSFAACPYISETNLAPFIPRTVILFGRTRSPCSFLHEKYLLPCTEPSFFPFAVRNSTPTQIPSPKSVGPMYLTFPVILMVHKKSQHREKQSNTKQAKQYSVMNSFKVFFWPVTNTCMRYYVQNACNKIHRFKIKT